MDNNILKSLNEILQNSDLTDVSSESSGRSLEDGYYLCEVQKGEIKETSQTHQPMVSLTMKVVEDGYKVEIGESDVTLNPIKNTKNSLIWINYVIKDEASLKRFASDMLKFEAEEGKPLLEKEAFMEASIMEDAISLLEGNRIYVQVSTTQSKDGQNRTWNNLISWKRADKLNLPM